MKIVRGEVRVVGYPIIKNGILSYILLGYEIHFHHEHAMLQEKPNTKLSREGGGGGL